MIPPNFSRFMNISDDELFNIFEEYFGGNIEEVQRRIHIYNLTCSHGLLIINIMLDYDLGELPQSFSSRNELDIEQIDKFWQIKVLIEEISAIFRLASHLVYHCDYPIIPSKTRNEEGGILYIDTQSKRYSYPLSTALFTYPVTVLKDTKEEFQILLTLLGRIWHLGLWPLLRFIKPFEGDNIKMEGILDLLFSLDGLFERNTPSIVKRLACITYCAKDKNQALLINNIMSEANKIRNKIVHDGEIYTGMESIIINKEEMLTQKLFWQVKRVVAQMMQRAVIKVNRAGIKKDLYFETEDVLRDIIMKIYKSN